jgi:hypothetical protein
VSEPPSVRDEDLGRRRGNIAALIAIVVLAIPGYWAFHAIDQERKLQKCLDEGRRDCLELVSPGK